MLILFQGDGGQGGQGALQQLVQVELAQLQPLLVVDAGLGQQLAQQPIAAIERQQHLLQGVLTALGILGGQRVLAVDAQHRQRGAQLVGRLVGELLLPLYGVGKGVHQPVDLVGERGQLLSPDLQVERAQVGRVALTDGLGQLAQRRQPAGDEPPQQAEQEGQGDEQRQHGQGGHLAGQLAALVVPLRHDEPGLRILVVEGEGAPLVVVLGDAVEAGGQRAEGLAGGAGGAQQYAALLAQQLEVEVALELVAEGGDLSVFPPQVEALVFLPRLRVALLPLLIDGAVGGQLAVLFQIAAEQLVGDAGRLGEPCIEQLLHFVARFQIADEGADGQAGADQRQDAGEQKAADGAGTRHARPSRRWACSSWGMM